jgi:hypothetical protein
LYQTSNGGDLAQWRLVLQTSKLERFVLNVSIGGKDVAKRPSSFDLLTDQEFHSVVSKLRFPANSEIGKEGDQVTVSFSIADEKHLLFTGEIYMAGIYGKYRELVLTDGYKKLCDTSIIAAYRKEKAKVILQDILDKAGIDKTAITCPTVELARFSTEKIPADMCIKQLVKALEEHGHKGIRFFFDAENKFRFGTADDTGKNEGTIYEFENGRNILKLFSGWIEVFPLPIRHSQEVVVNGVKLITHRTALYVGGSHSRLSLCLKKEK